MKTLDEIQFVTPGEAKKMKDQHRLLDQDTQTIKRPGEAWQFTGIEARDWGIVKFLADDRRDVVRQMQLSPGMVPPLSGQQPSANDNTIALAA